MTDIIIIPALKKMRTAISKKFFRPLTSTYIFRDPDLSQDLSLMLNESDENDYNVIIKTGRFSSR